MTHSIQTIGGQVALFDDSDLLAITAFIIDEVESNNERYPHLVRHISHWRVDRACYGPGVIDLRLEDILNRQEQRREFRNALLAVRERVANIGEVIPAHALNSLHPVPGVTFYDYSAAALRKTLDRLLSMVDVP